ncbi:hypothetical protein P0J00_004380 [Vibrio vulnificus]|nr:hypothetical protein [Vibrio vulnificus]
MQEQRIKIPRAADKSLIACFKELTKYTDTKQVTIAVLGFNNVGAVDLIDGDLKVLELIEKKNSAIIETISMNVKGFNIIFYRGGSYQPQDKSGIFDEIVLRQNNQGAIEPENSIEIVTIINRKLKAFDPKRSPSANSSQQAEFDAIHISNLERLEALNENLVQSTHEYRLQLDSEFNDKAEKLESNAEELRRRLEAEYQEKELQLQLDIDALDKKRKALDDSSNTHARREIRRDILKEIKLRQTKFSLTEGTNKLRKPIAIAMIALISIFVVLGAVSVKEFYDALQTNELNVILITGIKQSIYTVGAIGSIIFMIRWMNRWFELHSQSEFELKRFELDMERASWLVETSLEWKDAKGTAIPPELLGSLSNNLFVNDNEKLDPLQHPVDQLASALIGSASAVKLRAGDSSIEIDPKKLAKSKPRSQST